MKIRVGTLLTAVLFASGTFAAAYFTGFEEGNKGSYVEGTVCESNIVWTLASALNGTLTADNKEGVKCIRLARNNGVAEASMSSQVITGSFGFLSFKYAKYGTGSEATIEHMAEYSTDDGGTWVQIGTNFYSSTTALQVFEEAFMPQQNINIRIRTLSGGTGTRVRSNIDTLALIPEPGTAALVLGGLALAGWLARRAC